MLKQRDVPVLRVSLIGIIGNNHLSVTAAVSNSRRLTSRVVTAMNAKRKGVFAMTVTSPSLPTSASRGLRYGDTRCCEVGITILRCFSLSLTIAQVSLIPPPLTFKGCSLLPRIKEVLGTELAGLYGQGQTLFPGHDPGCSSPHLKFARSGNDQRSATRRSLIASARGNVSKAPSIRCARTPKKHEEKLGCAAFGWPS